MNHYARLLALPLCMGAIPALAHEVPMSWQPVSDDVLAHATGKYMNQNMISGFQLDLISQWQTPSGASLYAAGSVNVQQGSNGYTVNTGSQTGILPGNNTNYGPGFASAHGGNLIQVNGVGQVTQVAGNGNALQNQTVIDFSPTQGGLGLPSGGTSSTSLDGMNAQVMVGQSGVNVSLQSPFGSVVQTITSGGGSPMNRIMQVIQVAGNNQQVLNSMLLHLRTDPVTMNALRQVGVNQALTNTLGLRR